ncbi:MAG: Prolipoprotein diacylglyceryl transferase, partial [uncultured Gemmatimonadetes bacterium]
GAGPAGADRDPVPPHRPRRPGAPGRPGDPVVRDRFHAGFPCRVPADAQDGARRLRAHGAGLGGRPAVHVHPGRDPGRAAGLHPLLRLPRLCGQPRADHPHLGRRPGLSRRSAGRADGGVVVFSQAQGALPAPGRRAGTRGSAGHPDRAHRQLHQRRAVRAGDDGRGALGRAFPHRPRGRAAAGHGGRRLHARARAADRAGVPHGAVGPGARAGAPAPPVAAVRGAGRRAAAGAGAVGIVRVDPQARHPPGPGNARGGVHAGVRADPLVSRAVPAAGRAVHGRGRPRGHGAGAADHGADAQPGDDRRGHLLRRARPARPAPPPSTRGRSFPL